MLAQNKAMTWIGWVLTVFAVAMLSFSAVMKLTNHPEVKKALVDNFGYPEEVTVPLGAVELCCALLFLFPRTAILGAVLLTGYLGGAIATHVRILDNFAGPAIGGVLVWLAVFLRDPRVRALLPWRRPLPSV